MATARMDPELLALGRAVTSCQWQTSCPGIKNATVLNRSDLGVPPRGFLVRPANSVAHNIEIVVIGQNPGRAGGYERVLNRHLNEVHPDRMYEAINDAALAAMESIKYWARIDRLLSALLPNGSRTPLMAAELAYCENAPTVGFPGSETLKYCSTRHLKEQLRTLRDKTICICVGAPARDWFREYSDRARFRWTWIPHITGARRTIGRLFDDNGVRSTVRARWQQILDETLVGESLIG